MLTYSSNPLKVPTISLSPWRIETEECVTKIPQKTGEQIESTFIITQILLPMHLSISAKGCNLIEAMFSVEMKLENEWTETEEASRKQESRESNNQESNQIIDEK